MSRSNIMIVIIMLFCASAVFAQSDYEFVQSFKKNYKQIEDSINSAGSMSELMGLKSNINSFEQKYREKRELLNEGLYPDDFNSAVAKLRNKLELRSNDFGQIDELQTQVVVLKLGIDSLNQRNNQLLSQIQSLEIESRKDKSRIAQLERSIAQLKNSLRERDELLISMIDSLIPSSAMNGENLSEQEKKNIYSEAKRKNIVENIKRSINDNIRFLKVTSLNKEDIEDLKKQQKDFQKVWKNAGSKIVKIYSEKGDTNNLQTIDSSLSEWNKAITTEVWSSINDEIKMHDIDLPKFSNGEEFTREVISYINDEIKSAEVKSQSDAEYSYKNFADSVWFGTVKSEWVSYLKQNNMISDSQIDTIETKIKEWKEKVYPNTFNWMYVIIGILVIAVIILVVKLLQGSKPTRPANSEE